MDQLWHKFADAFITPVEDTGIVVVTNSLVVHHVLKIAYDFSGAQIPSASRNQRLVHVQSNCTSAVDPVKGNVCFMGIDNGFPLLQDGFDFGFLSADIGNTINIFG